MGLTLSLDPTKVIVIGTDKGPITIRFKHDHRIQRDQVIIDAPPESPIARVRLDDTPATIDHALHYVDHRDRKRPRTLPIGGSAPLAIHTRRLTPKEPA